MPDGTDRRRDGLDRRIDEARLVLGFERLWPYVIAAVVLAALFVALSWCGVWTASPRVVRVLGVAGFVAAAIAVVLAGARERVPSRRDALARLDRDSGLKHRPVSAREDVLANPQADATTRALWDIHRRRLDAAVARVRVSPPSPRLVDRDPLALRAAVLVALAAAAFVAGPDKLGRLAAAFDWRASAPPGPGFRLDAWIDPPAYTGRPPILLSTPNGTGPTGAEAHMTAPVNSAVVVRSAGEGAVAVSAEGGLKVAPAPAAAAKGGNEQRFVLGADGRLTVTRDGKRVADAAIGAIPDLPPTIASTGRPTSNARGSLTLSYKINDDYGVVGAEANFARPVIDGVPVKGRTLVEPPKMTLSLPAAPRGLGEGQTTADLSDNPWAGADVTMTLSARDEGGNVGTSPPETVRLPARFFTQPLARALVEQRRNLVLDPDHREGVTIALDALTLAPDLFGTTPAIYLGLRAAKTRLDAARTDPDLVGVADLLWAMALQIEDGDLSQTERDLRALQEQLKDALARNAPPEEIKKLTEALRQQLDKFLSELAEKGARSPDGTPQARASRTVTPRDLQAMLDRMEKSARDGDMADARRTLEELQNLLENLQSAKRGQAGDEASREMNQSMSALEGMMRDQQNLRDRTFQQGRRGRKAARDRSRNEDADEDGGAGQQSAPEAGQPNDGGDDPDGGSEDLARQQEALRHQLEQMRKRMGQLGLDGEGLADAEGAMKDAEGALQQGPGGNGRAVDAQGRALQALQKGQQNLAGQMAQGGGGEGTGEDGIGRENGVGDQSGSGADPLGRTRDGRGLAERGLDLQPNLAARAQQVLEELRRRLGEPNRPQVEQDYLERLLRRY